MSFTPAAAHSANTISNNSPNNAPTLELHNRSLEDRSAILACCLVDEVADGDFIAAGCGPPSPVRGLLKPTRFGKVAGEIPCCVSVAESKRAPIQLFRLRPFAATREHTAPAAVDTAPTAKKSRGISRGGILVLEVVVIPFALSAALSSYGALTTESALRMAFATVAGQTIAIISAIVAVVLTVRRRYAWPAIMAFALIAAVITTWAVGSMASAGDLLLDRLELIAEVDVLNR